MCPSPLIIRFFSLKTRGKLGGNQLPDGSIGLSSLRRRPKRFARQYRHEPLARVSPDFAFFKHFPGFFRVWLLLKPLSRSRSVAGVLCVCCACACVVVYCGKNTEKPEETERNACGMVCVLCGVVR